MKQQPDNLPPLNLPPADLRITSDGKTVKVFDPIRHRDVVLTPEEYVRQTFVAYLRDNLHYPVSIIANEVGIELNDTIRRCDTIVYGIDGSPLLVCEYKAPYIAVTQDVFDQIVRYNMTLHARYLVVSNGMRHYCCRIDYADNSYHFIPSVPDYHEIATDFSPN